MPATTVPNQFGDPTLSAAEAAAACGPAAAVAFARANGRNPTLREAVDLAKRLGWTEAGGMNGVANQQRLLERMGVAAELDAGATAATIGERARAGEMVTVSTPKHYYVVDGYDPTTGRVHVGQSGLARQGGSTWMTLEDIARRDGGINGALYQTVSDTGSGRVAGLASVASQEATVPGNEIYDRPDMNRPGTGPTRADKMRQRIADLQKQRATAEQRITALMVPGPDETPAGPLTSDIEVAKQARANRVNELTAVQQSAAAIDAAIRSAETDLANDPDPKPVGPTDPVKAERDRVELDNAKLAYSEAQKKAALATTPEATKLAQLEVKKAELAIAQAELNLEQDRNPRPPQRDPRYPDEVAQAEATLTRTQQEIEQGRKDLLPKQQQIFQAHQDTVKYIQGMWERGEIEPGQAEAYIKMSLEAAEASLRGSTPFSEMKEKREAETARQRMGIDLLNQRVSSGAGMASSLMSSVMGSNIMRRPGQASLDADPLAGLLPLLAQLQGGEDVMPFARGLLMGGQNGAVPSPAPMPAGL